MSPIKMMSAVLRSLSNARIDKFSLPKGLRADVLLSVIVVLSTVTFAIGVSVATADRAVTTESIEAIASGTPDEVVATNGPATADDAGNAANLGLVDVTAPTLNAQAGTDIEVNLTVNDMTGLNVTSWQGDLLYDPAVLLPQPSSATTQGTLSGFAPITVNPFRSGRIKLAWFITQPGICDPNTGNQCPGGGILIKIRFVVIGNIGSSSPLTFERNPGPGQNPWSFFNSGIVSSSQFDGQVKLATRNVTTGSFATVSHRDVRKKYVQDSSAFIR